WGEFRRGGGEDTITHGDANSLRLEIGSTLALDGHRRRVVGIVENPSKLSDEFALISPSSASPKQVDVLVAADHASTAMRSFFDSLPAKRSRSAFSGSMGRGNDVSSAGETLAEF